MPIHIVTYKKEPEKTAYSQHITKSELIAEDSITVNTSKISSNAPLKFQVPSLYNQAGAVYIADTAGPQETLSQEIMECTCNIDGVSTAQSYQSRYLTPLRNGKQLIPVKGQRPLSNIPAIANSSCLHFSANSPPVPPITLKNVLCKNIMGVIFRPLHLYINYATFCFISFHKF